MRRQNNVRQVITLINGHSELILGHNFQWSSGRIVAYSKWPARFHDLSAIVVSPELGHQTVKRFLSF